MRHDPHHVAQLAAMLLSSQPDPEKHHIKKAIDAAIIVLDEAFLRAEEDDAKETAKAASQKAAADKADEKPDQQKEAGDGNKKS